ncbi:unnamed protein product [Calypogeia fissa]
MGISEIDAPLLVKQPHVIDSAVKSTPRSEIYEEHVAAEEANHRHGSNEGETSDSQRKNCRWTTVVAVSVFCIAAIVIAGRVSDDHGDHEQTAKRRANVGDLFYDASRTSYHFQPPKNWMNGPMYYGGYYHLFYQYNPGAAVWGNLSWGHAVSKDLVNWMHLEVALYPDQWYDIEGVWSGSATILKDGTPAILYTGQRMENGVIVQSQSVAYPDDPSDPLLRKWRKLDNNPLFDPPLGHHKDDFRDPSTAWLEDDGLWRLIIGSKLNKADGTMDGMSMVYSSSDFYKWELAPNFHHDVLGSGMWECVDFFPIDCKPKDEKKNENPQMGPENYLDSYRYVLKASMFMYWQDFYTLGTYSTKTHKFTVDDPDLDLGKGAYRYDYGNYYASKSFLDPTTGRRVVWSWITESDSQEDDIVKGWASVLGIPRTIWLDEKTNKNLVTWPVEEVNSLRGAKASYQNIQLNEGDVIQVKGGDGSQLDIEVSFEKPDVDAIGKVKPEIFHCDHGGSAQKGIFGPFGLLVHADKTQTEQTAIFFYIALEKDGQWSTKVCSDQSRSSLATDLDKTVYGSVVTVLPTETELTMRILVDHSIVETFVQGGRQAVTSRVYPTVALNEDSHLFLFNNGSTPIKVKNLDVYQMNNANMITI